MKIGKAFIGFILLSGFYLGMLIWTDAKNNVLAQVGLLAQAMPFLLCISLLSYILRYARWHWLLARRGYKVNGSYGLIAYFSGFAFTATPGKVGELIRIRYFNILGVPSDVAFGAFIYERALDLIVVLILSFLVISRLDLLLVAFSFVIFLIGLLTGVVLNPALLTRLNIVFGRYSYHRVAQIILIVRDGLSSCRYCFTPLDVLISVILGLMAWSLTSYGFMWLLSDLGLLISPLEAFTIYPLSILVGAASMLPGGVGSTELSIILLLGTYGVTASIATVAAIGIRFATIWFAVLFGFICMGILEVWSSRIDNQKD